MAFYAYDPALRAPGKWSSIDFSDAKLREPLLLMVRGLSEKTASFEAPEGVRLIRQPFRIGDGAEIPVYVFSPENADSICGNMLYCHGGGFFLPIQPMMMQLAARYARELSIRVYLPEYRILPTYPSPYPFLDCLAVLHDILGQDLPYLLYGESVGGTLAAGLSLLVRTRGARRAAGQCLIYPALDCVCGRYPSMRRYSEAAWPLRNHLAMWAAYLRPSPDVDEAYLVPMKAKDLRGLPETYIEPQEMDIVCDEAIAFAGRLEEAGVPVVCRTVPGSYHGFDEDTENPFVQNVIRERIAQMGKMLDRGGSDS